MPTKCISVVVAIMLFFICICAFSQSLHAAELSTGAVSVSTVPSELFQATFVQTDTITHTTYSTDTGIIFQGLADAIQLAEILRFRGVDGMPISVYDPSKFGTYEERVDILAGICPDCKEPQCVLGPHCPPNPPYPLPCCQSTFQPSGKPCWISPTSALELHPKLLEFPDEVIAEHPEQVTEAVEHFSQYQEGPNSNPGD